MRKCVYTGVDEKGCRYISWCFGVTRLLKTDFKQCGAFLMFLNSAVLHMVETDLSMYNIIIKIFPMFLYFLLAKAIRNEFEM